MPSLNVIINGSAQPFERELQRVNALAATAGTNITKNMAQASQRSLTGIIRESVVIGREIAMGRGGGRIAGSFTLLFQYMRGLVSESHKAADAANIVAEAYERQALKAAQVAQASLRKAQASEMAFFDEGAESTATAAGADADRAKATADLEVAAATRAKATAAAQAATAEEAEATATGAAAESSFFAVTGASLLSAGLLALAVAAVVVYEKFRGLDEALKEADFNLPDLKDEYIPQLKRHMSDAKNAQREVTDEVRKTVEQYNSAAEAAKRVSDATKEHYSHLGKILEIRKQTELAGAHSPAARLAIEKKYDAQELQLQKDRQNEELLDKHIEIGQLRIESRAKLRAVKMVNTKEEDQQILGQLNTNAEAAQAFLKGGSFWQSMKEGAAVLSGVDPDEMKRRQQLIIDTEEGGKEKAQATIATRNKFADTVQGNDITRNRNADLVNEAKDADARAAKLNADLANEKAKNAQANKDTAEEQAAKLAEEKAANINKYRDGNISLNAQQKIGAYVTGIQQGIAEQSLQQLKGIKKNTDKPHYIPLGVGTAKFAGIHQ